MRPTDRQNPHHDYKFSAPRVIRASFIQYNSRPHRTMKRKSSSSALRRLSSGPGVPSRRPHAQTR